MRARHVLAFAWGLGACHSEPATPPRAGVSHSAHALAGVHCTRCHAPFQPGEPANAIHLPEDATCAGCHAAPHPESPDPACTRCHVDPDAKATLSAISEASTFDHIPHLERTRGNCVSCHRGAVSGGSMGQGRLPAMDDCRSCHAEWLDGLACNRCHTSLTAYPLQPISHQAHVGDYLRHHALEARAEPVRCAQCHSQSSCADCHDQRAPFATGIAWPDRPDRDFVHGPGYVERHRAEARFEPESCAGCHGTSSCNDCHSRVVTHSPHPAGWASPGPGENRHGPAARQDILACASCHGGAGGDLCVTCHAPGRPGGSPHRGRRPMGDPARDAPCRDCHGGRR